MKKLCINHSGELLVRLDHGETSVGIEKASRFIALLWLGLITNQSKQADDPMMNSILTRAVNNLRGCHRITIGVSLHVRKQENDEWILMNIHGFASSSSDYVYYVDFLFNMETGEIGL